MTASDCGGAATRRLGRRGRVAARVAALIGFALPTFLLLSVITDAVDRSGADGPAVPPGSVAAREGARHPGESVHVVAAAGAVAVAAVGVGSAVRSPERRGAAWQLVAVGSALAAAAVVVGDPDNHGGQAGPVDPLFAFLALPPLTAALFARPWRGVSAVGLSRADAWLATAGVPLFAWYGVDAGLMQRHSWPPLSDPHHQLHWWATAVADFLVAFIPLATALSRERHRLGWASAGGVAIILGASGLAAPGSASSLPAAAAAFASLWGAALAVRAARR